MEPRSAAFTTLIESYFEMWDVFTTNLLTSSALFLGQNRMMMPRAIPHRLQAEYRLLQLQADVSPALVRTRYRELAKLYHPDVGGNHADFLALQQAYERVMEYLQTQGCS